ncbi:uncharacterized protein [Heliangelus exortis]|uniref:uncharacterized protein isoform X1 n=1 Tax=Heliangelus exortis TaxID=472823 RepID=UPI003A8D404D
MGSSKTPTVAQLIPMMMLAVHLSLASAVQRVRQLWKPRKKSKCQKSSRRAWLEEQSRECPQHQAPHKSPAPHVSPDPGLFWELPVTQPVPPLAASPQGGRRVEEAQVILETWAFEEASERKLRAPLASMDSLGSLASLSRSGSSSPGILSRTSSLNSMDSLPSRRWSLFSSLGSLSGKTSLYSFPEPWPSAMAELAALNRSEPLRSPEALEPAQAGAGSICRRRSSFWETGCGPSGPAPWGQAGGACQRAVPSCGTA